MKTKKTFYFLPVILLAFILLVSCFRKKKDDVNPTGSNSCVHCLLYQGGVMLVDAGQHCGTSADASNWYTNMQSGGYSCHYE